MKGTLLGKHFLGLLIAVAFCLSAVEKVQAQWVNIPDANFRAAIAALVPSAISGTDMDTMNTGIVNMKNLDVSALNIGDLEGIQYFDSLKYLNCKQNYFYSIPTLPSTLISLVCENDLNIDSLPPLPNTLRFLSFYNCSIKTFPNIPPNLLHLNCSANFFLANIPALPSSLTYLNCSSIINLSFAPLPPSLDTLVCLNDGLTSLPALPASLKFLSCTLNSLTSLPTLPSSLTYLFCNYNSLTSLSVLPSSLIVLECNSNLLTSLPSLPNSLKALDCANNLLSSLPPLPTNLIQLECSNNPLTSFPSILPSSLNYLACAGDSLTSLPPLPSTIIYLDCSNNFIPCLPLLPEALEFLIDTNAVNNCLPNMPPLLTSILGPDSLCTSSNSTCYIYPIISGTSYNDNNLNLSQNVGEKGHLNLIMQVQPGNYFFPIKDSTGYYYYTVDSGAAYTITTNSIPYYNIVPISQSTPVLYYAMVDSVNDFALQPIGIVHDLSVIVTSVTHPIRGFDLTHTLTATNNGTVTDTASLQYVFDSNLTYVSSSPAASVVNGDTLQWNNIRLIPGQKSDFQVTFHIANSVPLSTNLYSYAVVNPVALDTTPVDNVDTLHQVVIGSYDPNDKAVTPEGAIPLAKIAQGQWLDYTIRFQNTGTAPAFKVEIKDTLSSKLDLSTLQIISSSHEMTWSVRHSVAYFEFDNINLPDSGADEAASHGFVRYRMKAYPNLSAGDMIKNTAYIYFDQNSAIVTNTTSSNVCQPNARSLTVNICHDETYNFNGQTIDSAGAYYSTLTNIGGCDSVITLQLIVNHADTTVVVSQDTLSSQAESGSYQWINCSTGLPENGATNYFFIPANTDGYAVIVTQNNCADTSACYSVLLTGEASLKNNHSSVIYPNPAHDEIMINGRGMFIIMNLLGEKVSEGMLKQDGQSVIIKDLPMGIYFVQVVNDNGQTVRRFLKQ